MLPQVATFIEQGSPDYTVGAWFGMVAPAATLINIAKRLQSVIWEAQSSRELIVSVLLKIGFERDTTLTPERFPAFLRDHRRRWVEAVAQINPSKRKT